MLKKQALISFILALATLIPVYATAPMHSKNRIDNTPIFPTKNKTNQAKQLKIDYDTENDVTINSFSWGVVYNKDTNRTWYYSQDFEERGWYLEASNIVLYDNNFKEQGSLRIEIPENLNVNDIHPLDFITNTFFDNDQSNTEIPIYIHAVDNGKQIHLIHIYRTSGEKLIEYNGYAMLYFDASESNIDHKRTFLVRYANENEAKNKILVEALAPAQENEIPQIEHTFSVDEELINYSDGPFFNHFVIGGKPIYTLSHYKKPCMDGYDPSTFTPIQAKDNFYVIKSYDQAYNMLDSISIPVAPSDEEAMYGFATFGLFTYQDLSLGKFSNDDQRNYIVTHSDYYAISDSYSYYFKVYNQEGEYINTISKDVETWIPLSNLQGHEEQMAFLKTDEQGIQHLEMVDMPSCKIAASFPSIIDGQLITTTFDRYPVGNDYQYVISMAQATENKDGEAIARIGWFNRDCSVDHYAEFNIGKNAQGFTPYIANYTLNPYLFNYDGKREYLYLAQNKREDSEIIDKILYLADEDGNVLRTFNASEGDEIEFSSGDIFDVYTDEPKMVISFYIGDKDSFEVQFYNLPFVEAAIENITTDNTYIQYNGNTITASHAQSITLYNIQGVLIATTDKNQLSTKNLPQGLYVVAVKDNNNNTHSRKIVVE